jgi:hypothetical protein
MRSSARGAIPGKSAAILWATAPNKSSASGRVASLPRVRRRKEKRVVALDPSGVSGVHEEPISGDSRALTVHTAQCHLQLEMVEKCGRILASNDSACFQHSCLELEQIGCHT